MPNFTLSEILTIMLVILVVFGPERLPEMARKAGELVRKARSTVADLRREFDGEWQDVAQPLKDVRDEIKGVQAEVQSSMASLSDDVARAKEELEAEMQDTKKEIEGQLAETEKKLQDTIKEPETPGADDGDDDGEAGSS